MEKDEGKCLNKTAVNIITMLAMYSIIADFLWSKPVCNKR